jgi:hypothetical protein
MVIGLLLLDKEQSAKLDALSLFLSFYGPPLTRAASDISFIKFYWVPSVISFIKFYGVPSVISFIKFYWVPSVISFIKFYWVQSDISFVKFLQVLGFVLISSAV